jgi:hypothetical protein
MPFPVGSNWTDDEFHSVIEEIMRRSKTDLAFRSLAISDSPAAFLKVASKPLPEGYVITFVDNDGPFKTIPLP